MVDLHRQYLDIRDEVDRAIGDVIAETAFIKGPAVGLFEEELAPVSYTHLTLPTIA